MYVVVGFYSIFHGHFWYHFVYWSLSNVHFFPSDAVKRMNWPSFIFLISVYLQAAHLCSVLPPTPTLLEKTNTALYLCYLVTQEYDSPSVCSIYKHYNVPQLSPMACSDWQLCIWPWMILYFFVFAWHFPHLFIAERPKLRCFCWFCEECGRWIDKLFLRGSQ